MLQVHKTANFMYAVKYTCNIGNLLCFALKRLQWTHELFILVYVHDIQLLNKVLQVHSVMNKTNLNIDLPLHDFDIDLFSMKLVFIVD